MELTQDLRDLLVMKEVLEIALNSTRTRYWTEHYNRIQQERMDVQRRITQLVIENLNAR